MENQDHNINSFWCGLIIEELVRNGIEYFCISPGSRSAPLTVAAARNPGARTIICIDERGAAYHAVGYARGSGKPAAVISTSGTAAANYYPAVIEASADNLPLILLTADRPPELRDTGANQTIDQVGLYGKQTRWFFDMPCPDEKIPVNFVLTTVDQAVYRAKNSPSGPVHLNCMFREPLAPVKHQVGNSYIASINKWQKSRKPYTTYINAKSILKPDKLDELLKKLNNTKRGLLVVGKLSTENEKASVKAFAQILNWPVFADINSGINSYGFSRYVIPYFDQLFLSKKLRKKLSPDTILHIGGRITSKRFLTFLENEYEKDYVVFQNHPFRSDPAHRITDLYETDISELCDSIAKKVVPVSQRENFVLMLKLSRRIEEILKDLSKKPDKLSEINVPRSIISNTSAYNGLFLASSMPVRDMDMYARSMSWVNNIASNRGASGIDGTIASAAGYAAGLKSAVTLLIGDLASIHDLNSLSLLKNSEHPVTVVIINNQGGGIFSFLPISDFGDVFEQFFETPHNLNFKSAAGMFDLPYYNPSTVSEFVKIYRACISGESSSIIEIKTDRKENFELHQKLQNRIRKEIDKFIRESK